MKSFKEITERAKASPETKARLAKDLDKSTAASMKLVVKNTISGLDQLAWKLENQVKVNTDVSAAIKKIDMLIKDAKSLEKELKKILKV